MQEIELLPLKPPSTSDSPPIAEKAGSPSSGSASARAESPPPQEASKGSPSTGKNEGDAEPARGDTRDDPLSPREESNASQPAAQKVASSSAATSQNKKASARSKPPPGNRANRNNAKKGKPLSASSASLASTSAPKKKAVGKGGLTVFSRPWVEVWTDGKKRGVSPLQKYSLPSGKRNILVRNKKMGIREKWTIQIPKGGVYTLKLVFEKKGDTYVLKSKKNKVTR